MRRVLGSRWRGDLARLGTLVEPVRRRLYEYVAARGEPVAREEAATAVGIARPLAIFHLEKLVRAGLVEPAAPPLATARGRGRPSKFYRRTARSLEVVIPGREYGLLGRILTRALERRWRALRAPVLEVARETGRDLARSKRLRPARRPSTNAYRVVQALAELGYEPRIEAGGVRLMSCPFEELAREHRDQVCAVNLAFLRGLASFAGRRLEPVGEPRPGAGECCVRIQIHAS